MKIHPSKDWSQSKLPVEAGQSIEARSYPTTPVPPPGRDRQAYESYCTSSWSGDSLRNAKRNWELFEEHYEDLVAIIKPYLADCLLKDISGKIHNPEGTLTGWLWKCSNAPENSWLWDFCEHYQKCHLSRGLIAYCKQVIAEIKATYDPSPGHPEIALDFDTPPWSPPRAVRLNGVEIPYAEYMAGRRE